MTIYRKMLIILEWCSVEHLADPVIKRHRTYQFGNPVKWREIQFFIFISYEHKEIYYYPASFYVSSMYTYSCQLNCQYLTDLSNSLFNVIYTDKWIYICGFVCRDNNILVIHCMQHKQYIVLNIYPQALLTILSPQV